MMEETFDPVKEFVNLRDNLGRAVERGIRSVTGSAGFPAVDIYESQDALFIRTEPIAGLQKDTLDIGIENNILSIQGLCADDKDDVTFLYREIHYGRFDRKVRLPRVIDATKTKASVRDGIIIITMPKVKNSESTIVDVTPAE